jgi:hypothetical protein
MERPSQPSTPSRAPRQSGTPPVTNQIMALRHIREAHPEDFHFNLFPD